MRRRSTFVHDSDYPADPDKIQVKGDVLDLSSLHGAREERLSFAFNELPQELWQVLKQSHELHIRWVTELPYLSQAPFVSRVSPGLHVFYTPSIPTRDGVPVPREEVLKQRDLLCPLLRKVFGNTLDCQSALKTFTTPPILSERFAHTASLQYYSILPSLDFAIEYIQHKICKHSDLDCIRESSRLISADSLDIDYDSISHSLRLTAYWSRPEKSTTKSGWTESISSKNSEAVEVGILSVERATDPVEISLSGFLTVVGEDSKPAPTLFSFPSRHHPLPPSQRVSQKFSVAFKQPTGLHPTLQISFPSAKALVPPMSRPAGSQCALHTYLTLPSAVFPDRYQLETTDPLFLSSHNLVSLRGISGELDLEAPDYLESLRWGSNTLLELATPNPSDFQQDIDAGWNVTIPLHLRYLPPNPTGHDPITIPNPIVFWACTAEEGSKFPVNPFDRVNLGWDGLFGERIMFYQLRDNSAAIRSAGSTSGSRLVQKIQVSVLKTEGTWATPSVVESGTVLVVVLGFIWILVKLLGVATGPASKEQEKQKEKKTQ